MSNLKFIILFCIFSFMFILSIGFLNYLNDPRSIELQKTKQYNIVIDRDLERKLKLFLYKSNKSFVENIIMGSSRVTIIDAESLGENSFNFAFSGATLDEILYLLENEIDIKRLKVLYIGLDEFMFDFSDKIFINNISFFYNQSMDNKVVRYISIDTFWKSCALFFVSKKYIYSNLGDKIIVDGEVPTKQSINKYLDERMFEINNGYCRFNIDKIYILNKIISLIKQHNIDLKLFINPISKELRNFYKNNNSDYEQFLVYLKDVEYYNFNYDNEITNNIYKYYYDPHHYHKDVGKMIINFIKNNGKNTQFNFGIVHEPL